MNVTLARVLADIDAGRVAAYSYDTYVIPTDVPLEQAETYRLLVHQAVTRGWAAANSKNVLELSENGRRWRLAPGPYTSPVSYSCVDGVWTVQPTSR